MQKKVYIEWAGCNRRKLETAKISHYLVANGYQIVARPEDAECLLVTTCAFKEKEEKNSLCQLKRLEKYNKKMFVYGCLPDISPSQYSDFSHIAHIAPKDIEKIDEMFHENTMRFHDVQDNNVLRPTYYPNLFEVFTRKAKQNFEFSSDFLFWVMSASKKALTSAVAANRKYYIQTGRGCLGACTYCSIKRAVGRLKSKARDTIIEELKNGIVMGYKEFVLVADDLGAYGLDNGSSFPDLIGCIIDTIVQTANNIPERKQNRFKVNMHLDELHPRWIIRYREQMLVLIQSEYITSIMSPLQSGSDRILKLMKREHTVEEFLEAQVSLKEENSHLEWQTQIIVGFPSETEADFDQTLEIIRQAHFDPVIIFPYHEKEKSPSIRLPGKIPARVIQARIKKARTFFRKNRIQWHMSCID